MFASEMVGTGRVGGAGGRKLERLTTIEAGMAKLKDGDERVNM